MYKTIFVINIIIYMCLQHIDIYEFKTAVFLSLRERICFPNEFTPLRMLSLLLKDYRGLTGWFLLLQNFCVAISVSPHVCFILVLILISMFLR